MKTKIPQLIIAGLLLCFVASGSVQAAIVYDDIVLFDDFDGGGLGTGDGTSINGGFELVSNGVGGNGTVGETPSNATITTHSTAFNNTGIVSVNSFDPTLHTGFSVTWDIASQSGVGDGFNNVELLVQGGTGFRATNWIEFRITSGGNWAIVANGGTLHTGPGGGLGGGVPDGYTVTMEFDQLGYSVSAAGFTTNPDFSEAWDANFDYSDFSSSTHFAAMIQNDGSAPHDAFMNVNSISVAVPEPSSTALLGLGGLALALRRRRS